MTDSRQNLIAALPQYDLDPANCKRVGVPHPCRVAAALMEGERAPFARHLYDVRTGERIAGIVGLADSALVDSRNTEDTNKIPMSGEGQ